MQHKASSAAFALLAVFLCCFTINFTTAQENIQLQVPPSLVECYNTSYFMNRDNRLPSNIKTLITLIEKVENYNNNLMDMRQMAVSLLHRFRQDGIQRAPGVVAAPGVLPYSPTGFQFPKFRILLSRLIPGNALNFPNNTLTREERCSLHFMLSSSFDTRVRGDENQVCNRLSQYRAQRIRRSPRSPPESGNNFLGDVELFDAKAHNRGVPESGRQMRQNNPDWTDIDYGTNTNNDQSISQCPVENGVIWTPWGSVTAGTVIAGIAAGLQQQNIQLRTLLALSSRPGVPNSRQSGTNYVDNRWAATLAGDLAEVALVQMPVSSTGTASVGANGAWNSTVMAKWYFLSQRQNLEMTDAEIRGGLDGLILAMNISSWNSQASNLKLSQVLRMYYSTDGVLGSGIMACNRKANFQNVAPYNTMVQQSAAFAQVLDREMQLRVTLSPDAIYNFSMAASNALVNYVPNYLNDISCTVSNPMPQDVTASITPMTNIYVFLDTTWQYYTVVDYLIYVLQRLNINPYASSVTLLAANDGSVIVNTTNYLSDIYEGWNVTTQGWYTPGFNLPNVLRTVQNLTQNYMNAQQANNTVGGRSLVALLMPYMTQVADGDSYYAQTQLQYINEQIPDLRFIYYTGGTVNRFQSFVQDPSSDLFALSPGQNVPASAGPVVNRIKQIPRRLINPACGSAWYTNQWNTYRMNQFARPGVTNFYRMAPNYFFGQGSNRVVTVNAQYSQQFTICTSRYVPLPTSSNSSSSMGPGFNNNNNNNANNGNNDITCQQITGSSFTYDLSNACNGYSTIGSCPPLYLSVQAPTSTPGYSGTTQTVSCSDPACQTPDQATYIVSVTNLGCYSGVAQLVASLSTLLLAILALQALH